MSKITAVKNISYLWFCSLIGAGFAFFIQIILARKLGVAQFGIFSSGLATVTLVAPLAGFGVAQFWLKIFGKEGWAGLRWLKSSFEFIFLSSSLILSFIFSWAWLGPHDYVYSILVSILSLHVLGLVATEMVSCKFQLEGNYLRLAIWQLSQYLIRFALIVTLVLLFPYRISVESVAIMYSAVAIAIIFIALIEMTHMVKGEFFLEGHEKRDQKKGIKGPCISDVIKQAWPFGLAAFFHLIYFQSDIIIIKYIVGAESAGMYNVAFTIMVAVYLLPSVIYQKFLLPKIHRWSNYNRERFYQVYKLGNYVMLVLGVCAMLAVWLISPWGVPFLFGEAFIESVDLLIILAICAPIYFLAFNTGSVLVTKEYMKVKVKFMGIVAVFNIMLNFILIPEYGATGAAYATVISNLVLLSLYYFSAQKFVFKIKY